MTLILGTHTAVFPLTRDIFGEDGKRVLEGELVSANRGDMPIVRPQSMLLLLHDGNSTLYAHPGFRHLNREYPSLSIRLDGDRLIFETGDRNMDMLLSNVTIEIGEMTIVPVDNVIEAALILHGGVFCAMGEACTGANRRRLELRRSVLVLPDRLDEVPGFVGGRITALCGKCFDSINKSGKHSVLAERVFFDGRKLLLHAGVEMVK